MSIRSLLNRVSRRSLAAFGMIAAAIIIPTSLLAWGPIRQTFTIEVPADKITFNSITNNPNIGDERNFVGIRQSGSANVWYDNVKAEKGKEYIVRMYVHNNAAANLSLVAENVTASFNLPTTTAKSIRVDGFLNSTNADPKEVYDHATFYNDSEVFNLAYIENSLLFENNSVGAGGGVKLSESIFTSSGVKLGYDKLDGKIPGCLQYAGYVSFKVKPQFAPVSVYTVNKRVSKHGANKFTDKYVAKPGEIVDFLIDYKNTGETQQNNVIIRDSLPANMTYQPGTTKYANANFPSGTPAVDDIVGGKGINVGAYAPGANAWAMFSAKVAENDKLTIECNKQSVLINTASVSTDGKTISDTAEVDVTKTCDEPETPFYSCNSLSVKILTKTSNRFTVDYTVKNATFKSVSYQVRDGSGTLIDTKSGSNVLDYTQAKLGKYSVKATIAATVDGKEVSATSKGCEANFEVKNDKIPDDLPVTGIADSFLGIFGLGSVTTAAGYYIANRKKLLR